MELGAYECRVYVDLGELVDGPRPVRRLAERLGHGTVPSIDEALLLLELEPEHAAIRERLTTALAGAAAGRARIEPGAVTAAAVRVLDGLPFDERRLWPVVRDALATAKPAPTDPDLAADIVRGLVLADTSSIGLDRGSVGRWFAEPPLRDALRVNDADGSTWFDRAAFELLVASVSELVGSARAAASTTAANSARALEASPAAVVPAVERGMAPDRLVDLAARAGYRVDRLLAELDGGPVGATPG